MRSEQFSAKRAAEPGRKKRKSTSTAEEKRSGAMIGQIMSNSIIKGIFPLNFCRNFGRRGECGGVRSPRHALRSRWRRKNVLPNDRTHITIVLLCNSDVPNARRATHTLSRAARMHLGEPLTHRLRSFAFLTVFSTPHSRFEAEKCSRTGNRQANNWRCVGSACRLLF